MLDLILYARLRKSVKAGRYSPAVVLEGDPLKPVVEIPVAEKLALRTGQGKAQRS